MTSIFDFFTVIEYTTADIKAAIADEEHCATYVTVYG
jgi:hypothetical protein